MINKKIIADKKEFIKKYEKSFCIVSNHMDNCPNDENEFHCNANIYNRCKNITKRDLELI